MRYVTYLHPVLREITTETTHLSASSSYAYRSLSVLYDTPIMHAVLWLSSVCVHFQEASTYCGRPRLLKSPTLPSTLVMTIPSARGYSYSHERTEKGYLGSISARSVRPRCISAPILAVNLPLHLVSKRTSSLDFDPLIEPILHTRPLVVGIFAVIRF